MASPVEAVDLLDPAQGAAAKSPSIYFNQRALSRANAQPSASDWDGSMAYLDTILDLGDEDATTLTDAYEQAAAADDA